MSVVLPRQQKYSLRILEVGVVPVVDFEELGGATSIAADFPFLEVVLFPFDDIEGGWVVGEKEG